MADDLIMTAKGSLVASSSVSSEIDGNADHSLHQSVMQPPSSVSQTLIFTPHYLFAYSFGARIKV